MSKNVQKVLFEEILLFVDPLRDAAEDKEKLIAFFKLMGWNFGDDGMPLAEVKARINETSKLIENVEKLLRSKEIESLSQVFGLLNSVEVLFEKIRTLPDTFTGAILTGDEIKEIAENIVHYLLIQYLQKRRSTIVEFLRLAEIVKIKKTVQKVIGTKIIREIVDLPTIDFNQFISFLKDPKKLMKKIYDLPITSDKIAEAKQIIDKLFPRIGELAKTFKAVYTYANTPQDLIALANEYLELKWENPPGGLDFDIKLMYTPILGTKFTWVIIPPKNLDIDKEWGDYRLKAKAASNVEIIKIDEKGNVTYEPSPVKQFNASLTATKVPDAETGLPYLIGEAKGTRLEIGDVSIGGSVEAADSDLDVDINLKIKKAKFVIAAGGLDGFMAKLIPSKGLEVPFDFLLGYSSKKSLYIGANSGLELAIPMHIEALGIVKVNEMYLKIKPYDGGINAESSLSGSASLGPLNVSFNEIGLKTKIDFNGQDKNIGFANLSVELKSPTGLSLTIDAGPVTGGGSLDFDEEKEEYSGHLELKIAGSISAKAIGIITTKMPDGSKGFSMLIVITAEFTPPFQLGYGFTLMAVGGLLGLNRTVLLEPLRDGVRTGSVNNLMFPQNVVANAPRIISDLKNIFPAYEGRFLVGPMGKLGWGTPTLISLSLGLIIEIPGNLAILGVLRIALPDEKVPLVKIQVAFVGTIDFDKKMLTFDASLFESSILSMTLEGDMAVRLKWGDNPDFILTVGGFHPAYQPPPLALPTLKRLAINILNTSIAKIRVECYQAVTSNTVQFGAKAEVYFDLKACSIKGHIAFDALFQFSPFYFVIQLSAGFSLKVIGFDLLSVRVKMSLEGPTPWRARGTGSISLLFFDVSADFDKTWGDKKNTSLPSITILPELLKEFAKDEQWSTNLKSTNNLLVTLRKFRETEASSLVLHPVGSLAVQQRLLPLTVLIDKVGNQKVADIKKAEIIKAVSGPMSFTLKSIDESFARAQYQNLKDAEKLSKPSFERMPSGVTISTSDNPIKNGKMVRKNIEYEVTIVDKEVRRPFIFILREIPGIYLSLLNGASVAGSVLSKFHLDMMQPFADKINISQESYAVAFTSNNKSYNGSANFASEMQAQTYMKEQIIKNPALKKEIHIIPTYELQEL